MISHAPFQDDPRSLTLEAVCIHGVLWGVLFSSGFNLRRIVKEARVAQKKGHPARIFVHPKGEDQDVLT